jgi:ABC-type multidrug transport system fused ATPase/permease subunit
MSSVLKLPEAAKDLFYELHHAVFADAVLIIATIGYYLWVSRLVGLVFIVGILLWAIITFFFHRSCSLKTYAKERSHDDMHDKIEEIVSNLVTIFVYDTGAQELRKLATDSNDYSKLLKQSLGCAFNFRVMYAVVVVGVFLAIMATSVSLVRAGKMSQPNFVAVFIVTFTTMGRLMAGYTSIKAMQHSLGIVKSTSTSVNETLNSDRDIPAPVPPTKRFDVTDITLEEVTYKTSDGKVILDSVSCKFESGKSSAIVGSIGSGKSTVIRLLMRLDRPNSGDISSGGNSIYDMSLSDWRKQVSLVPQQPKLLNRTLRENLTYGKKDADADKIIAILKANGLVDMAEVFSKRMDESCGKGGSRLSGGQRQILTLCRALLSDAKLILLDEPQSALDEKSAEQVTRFISTAMKGRTLVMITHSKAILSQVDDIFEMSNGKLVKRGKSRW